MIIRNAFGLLMRNTFEASQKKARNIFRTEKFQDYFWETNTGLFLSGSAFGLGKSIYYILAVLYWQESLARQGSFKSEIFIIPTNFENRLFCCWERIRPFIQLHERAKETRQWRKRDLRKRVRRDKGRDKAASFSLTLSVRSYSWCFLKLEMFRSCNCLGKF